MMRNLFMMRNPFLRRSRRKNHPVLRVLGGALVAAVGAGVVAFFPDIKRYIRMTRM
jgi:hypothetical protein